MRTLIRGGRLVLPEGLRDGELLLEDGRIEGIGAAGGFRAERVLDAAGCYVLPGLVDLRTEVRYGSERSRIDLWARDGEGREVYVEVKNATLKEGDFVRFPDAVTARGTKHLRELQGMLRLGHRAAIVFFVNRGDVAFFDAAREIDPVYAEELGRAAAAGVQVLPLQARLRAEPCEDGWSLAWSLEGVLPWRQTGAP